MLLLQEVSSATGRLPRRLQLPSIRDLSYKGQGGEASIWVGTMGGRLVVSRQTQPPYNWDWESEEGRLIKKVGCALLFCLKQRYLLTAIPAPAVHFARRTSDRSSRCLTSTIPILLHYLGPLPTPHTLLASSCHITSTAAHWFS